MNGKSSCWIVLIPAILLSACNLPTPAAASNGPQAWFDSPLPGATLPLAPIQLVSHFSDPGGISEIELMVNDGAPASFMVSDSGQSLFKDERTWTPEAPGEYAFWMRARNHDGVWSEYARTNVIIIGPQGLTTPTRTATVAPPSFPADFEGVSLSTDTVYTDRCGLNQVTLRVKAQHPAGIKAVVLFFRMQDAANGRLSPWNEGLAMNMGTGGSYMLTLTGATLAQSAGFSFDRALVFYQFVIQPTSGDYVRSIVYKDLNVVACGGAPPPPGPTETRPPHIGP